MALVPTAHLVKAPSYEPSSMSPIVPLILLCLVAAQAHAQEPVAMPSLVPDALLTVAETSGYTRTARHEEVLAQLVALEEASPLVRHGSMGRTFEGRDIPWISISDPPVGSAEEAAASGKLIVFAFANIHAGEVCGKEALVRLAREIVLAPKTLVHAKMLKDLVLVFAPIYNGDGNERFSTTSRPEQDGPRDGQGQRPNAQGLDLNRDSMKLGSAEARGMARFLTTWDPHLVIDTHTTNGSFHRYLLTYAPPLNPSGHPGPIGYVRNELLPTVSQRLLDRTGYDTFLYGNYVEVDGDPHGAWATYSSQPRFGAQYHGLRGHMSILTEAYSHAPYRDRVLVTLEFVRECLMFAAENAGEMRRVVTAARSETMGWTIRSTGEDGKVLGALPGRQVGTRHEIASAEEEAVIRGWVESVDADGNVTPTDTPRDYTVRHDDHFEATRLVDRPFAYLIPPGHDAVIENLRAHGLIVGAAVPEDFHPTDPTEVEVYRIDAIDRAEREFQGHRIVSVDVTPRREQRVFGDGWSVVPVQQQLGTLAVYLLEPASDDGLTAWGFFDDSLAVGEDFPVLRRVE